MLVKSRMKFSKFNVIYEDKEKYLLVNTMTGSIFKIDNMYKEIIEKKHIHLLSDEDKSLYLKGGIVIEDNIDENRIIKYNSNKEKYCSQVLSLTVLLTWACNFACAYCFEGKKTNKANSLTEETKEAIKKYIENMFEENRNLHGVSITLFGGEPLVGFEKNIDWLKSIKKMCEEKNKKFVTSIVTNGSLINRQIINWLSEINCEYIQITLDGHKKIHDNRRIKRNGEGTFEEVISGIETTVKSGVIKPLIRINIDKANLEEIEELLVFLKDKGLNACPIDFGIIRADNDENKNYESTCINDEELGDVLEKLWYKLKELEFPLEVRPRRKNLYCGLLSDTAFTITPEGHLYKCWEYLDNDKFYIGKIEDDGIVRDWNYNLVDWMTVDFTENSECCECAYLPICGGGCIAVSLEKYKTIHKNGCFKSKSIFEKQLKFYYKNILKQV